MVPVAVPAVAVAVLTGSVPMYIVGGVLVEPDSSYIPLIYPISPIFNFLIFQFVVTTLMV